MGTALQEVYDAFFSKISTEDFTYKADLVYQYFKAANGYSYKTVPETLTYTLFKDNVSLFIMSKAEIDGNVSLKYNGTTYVVNVLATDTLNQIADKIVIKLSADFNVSTNYSNTYPIILIQKSNEDLTSFEFADVDKTDCVVRVNQNYDGEYDNIIGIDSIELISLFMAREYYSRIVLKLGNQKVWIGTKDFNQIPKLKDNYSLAESSLSKINTQIYDFRQEFYTYMN